jgi:hypothetical protein
VFEDPLLKEHITLRVTLKKPRVPVRSTVAGSFAPICGPCSCTIRNGLDKEKILRLSYSTKLFTGRWTTVPTPENIRDLKQPKFASAKSQGRFSHAHSMGTDRLQTGKIAER